MKLSKEKQREWVDWSKVGCSTDGENDEAAQRLMVESAITEMNRAAHPEKYVEAKMDAKDNIFAKEDKPFMGEVKIEVKKEEEGMFFGTVLSYAAFWGVFAIFVFLVKDYPNQFGLALKVGFVGGMVYLLVRHTEAVVKVLMVLFAMWILSFFFDFSVMKHFDPDGIIGF